MKIHPIIMYPFLHPDRNEDINALFAWLDHLCTEPEYAKPITVVNRQTYYRYGDRESFKRAYGAIKESSSIVVDTWSVDTCQMWLSGFGAAFDATAKEHNSTNDVFWLIPGDFKYSSASGQEMLPRFRDLPEKVLHDDYELCIGEIETSRDDSKELIDTYSTYGLLYNWFPGRARELRLKGIRKPRSEFIAMNRSFLKVAMINSRWYAYEQTLVLLLLALSGKRQICMVRLSDIIDDHRSRDTPALALQQVERTERVLKHYWREEMIQRNRAWEGDFERLSARSAQIVNSALVIFEQAL